MQAEVVRFSQEVDFVRAAAEFIARRIRAALVWQERFTLALSGGHTPEPVLARLAEGPPGYEIDWPRVHLFWGDERLVPLTDPESNYSLAQRSLLSRITIPAANLHPVPTERRDARVAAELYQAELEKHFDFDQEIVRPRFDLILLGLGPDGHTASLFPGDKSLKESRRWVVPVNRPEGPPPVSRVSLSLPVINSARCVMFLVSGPAKEQITGAVLSLQQAVGTTLPAALVRPEKRLIWYICE